MGYGGMYNSMISKDCYISEKQIFRELILGARMYEISYGETFCLMFSLRYDENGLWKPDRMSLVINAPFWVGDQCQWEALCSAEKVCACILENCLECNRHTML